MTDVYAYALSQADGLFTYTFPVDCDVQSFFEIATKRLPDSKANPLVSVAMGPFDASTKFTIALDETGRIAGNASVPNLQVYMRYAATTVSERIYRLGEVDIAAEVTEEMKENAELQRKLICQQVTRRDNLTIVDFNATDIDNKKYQVKNVRAAYAFSDLYRVTKYGYNRKVFYRVEFTGAAPFVIGQELTFYIDSTDSVEFSLASATLEWIKDGLNGSDPSVEDKAVLAAANVDDLGVFIRGNVFLNADISLCKSIAGHVIKRCA